MRNSLLSLAILTVFFAVAFSSCVEENVSFDESLKLSFSSDTVIFDTLFIEQPSPTKRVMIYNNNKRALSISSIYLGGSSTSNFRFNVDGHIAAPGEHLRDIIIKGHDSLFVFIEVTPPRTNTEPCLIVSDSLIIDCNNNLKNIQLLAVGRDVEILSNSNILKDSILSSKKPYLVFGTLYVKEGAKLSLTEGTELFMHGGSNIIVDGSIECLGTYEKNVLIRGDRFDKINDVDHTPYDQTAGQWGTIDLRNPQSYYIFRNTNIRGSSGGIILRGALRSSPKLLFVNSIIHNSSLYGIYSQMGDVIIENSELSNCGESCIFMIGGSLKVAHSTIANYYRFGSRDNRSVRLMNYIVNKGQIATFPISSAVIENSIIFGDNNEELELAYDTVTDAEFNVFISYTLIKGKRVNNSHFNNCFWAKSRNLKNAVDTVFINTSVENIKKTGYFDFHLDSLSYARDCGTIAISSLYPKDLDGCSRIADGKPDLGAYERIDK